MTTVDFSGGDPQFFAIIRRYARKHTSGRLMRCKPSILERAGGKRREKEGSDWKVIYDTEDAAKNCAIQIELRGGPKMRAYPCRRSRHGHYHLTMRLDDGERRPKRCLAGS